MQLAINGQTYTVADSPERPLIWVLRDELGLMGTRPSCGAGFCGSCTVHLDGAPTRSCITSVSKAANHAIATVEGLTAVDGSHHPVLQAFIDAQVPQCGWCMSGQMMSAVALLAATPTPTDDEIDAAMTGNLCRCGAYQRIRRAIHLASEHGARQA